MWPLMVGWIDPWGWVAWAMGGTLLGVLGLAPIGTKADASTAEVWAVGLRKAGWATVVFLPILAAAVFLTARNLGIIAETQAWFAAQAWQYGPGVLAAWVGGFGLRVLVARFAIPYFSARLRRARVTQATDGKTDIREEVLRYAPREFDPEKHTDLDRGLAMGQDAERCSVFLDWEVFCKTHMQVIGPTRYGKGVLLGNVLKQCVHKGLGTWYFDPKGDDHLPYILAEAAKAVGRPFYVLDLITGVGSYAPFAGGTAEERAERVITSFRLESAGGDSDFYKRTERQLLRKIFVTLAGPQTDLETIRKHFEVAKRAKFAGNEKRATDSSSIEDGLDEWKSALGIGGKPSTQSLHVERAINESWVVYVRCRTRGITRDIARCLIQELTETVLRVRPRKQGQHVVAALDEARALFSNVVVDALTTVAGAGMTLMPAYQSVLDVRNLDDERMDPAMVEAAVNVNCQVKFVHGTRDFETAEAISLLTGTRRVLVPQSEATEIGAFGGERWSDKRAFREDEDALIPPNTISALPERIGVFLPPGEAARLVWTCWAGYDKAPFDRAMALAEGEG